MTFAEFFESTPKSPIIIVVWKNFPAGRQARSAEEGLCRRTRRIKNIKKTTYSTTYGECGILLLKNWIFFYSRHLHKRQRRRHCYNLCFCCCCSWMKNIWTFEDDEMHSTRMIFKRPKFSIFFFFHSVHELRVGQKINQFFSKGVCIIYSPPSVIVNFIIHVWVFVGQIRDELLTTILVLAAQTVSIFVPLFLLFKNFSMW